MKEGSDDAKKSATEATAKSKGLMGGFSGTKTASS